jgi:hypothetical protein
VYRSAIHSGTRNKLQRSMKEGPSAHDGPFVQQELCQPDIWLLLMFLIFLIFCTCPTIRMQKPSKLLE